jgi:hypothetical protein
VAMPREPGTYSVTLPPRPKRVGIGVSSPISKEKSSTLRFLRLGSRPPPPPPDGMRKPGIPGVPGGVLGVPGVPGVPGVTGVPGVPVCGVGVPGVNGVCGGVDVVGIRGVPTDGVDGVLIREPDGVPGLLADSNSDVATGDPYDP